MAENNPLSINSLESLDLDELIKEKEQKSPSSISHLTQQSGSFKLHQSGQFARISGTWEAMVSDPQMVEVVGNKGELSDQYKMGSQIGMGGTAIVYEGWRLSDDKHVVVKIMSIPPTFVPNELITATKRFYREASVIASLKEEHIRQCLDYGLFHGIPCMVLEYIDGQSLIDLLKEFGAIPLKSATEIIEQVLLALDEPHRKGVIHRDIKPANIMVCSPAEPPYEIKVLDFGIATVLSTIQDQALMTQQGMTRGTPSYMAPELFTGNTQASIESDLYAVGLMYLEMLTGKVVFDATTYMHVAYKQVNEPLQVPVSIPKCIADIIFKLCRKDPIDRYHSALQVLEDIKNNIDTALADEKKCADEFSKTQAYYDPVDVQTKTAPPQKSSSKLPIVIAAIVLAAAAIVVAVIFTRPAEQPPAVVDPQPQEQVVAAAQPVEAVEPPPVVDNSEAIRAELAHVKLSNAVNMAGEKVASSWALAGTKVDADIETNKAKDAAKRASQKTKATPKKDTPAPTPANNNNKNTGGRRPVDKGSALPF